jgi:hypothetical protein
LVQQQWTFLRPPVPAPTEARPSGMM